MPHHICFPIILFMLLATGCFDRCTSGGTTYNDKGGLISFSLPEDWVLRNEANGMRFGRADTPEERTILSVIPKPHDPKVSLEQKREVSRMQIRQQGAEVMSDQSLSVSGFSAWETVYKMGSQTVHSAYLFSDEVYVQVMLVSKSEMYSNYVSDLESVVQSIRVNFE